MASLKIIKSEKKMKKFTPICCNCGSKKVLNVTGRSWDRITQSWLEKSSPMYFCEACGEEHNDRSGLIFVSDLELLSKKSTMDEIAQYIIKYAQDQQFLDEWLDTIGNEQATMGDTKRKTVKRTVRSLWNKSLKP